VSKIKILALSFLGIMVPVGLAFTAFLISRSTIGSAGTVPSLTHTVGTATTLGNEPTAPQPSPTRTEDGKQGSGTGGVATPTPGVTATSSDDHSGKCSEPEHLNDPECLGGGSSGKGSGDSSGRGKGDD
jgi:hypothetical protein